MYYPKPKHCVCDKPFSDCPYATETPHGDKWYCELKTKKEDKNTRPSPAKVRGDHLIHF